MHHNCIFSGEEKPTFSHFPTALKTGQQQCAPIAVGAQPGQELFSGD